MWRRVAAALVVVLLGGAGAAFGQSDALDRTTLIDLRETGPAEVNLDGDPQAERVLARKIDRFRFEPRLEDDCAGTTIRRRLGPQHDAVTIESLRALGATLLFVSGSSGASGRVGDYALYRLGPRTDALGCPGLTTLFALPHDDFSRPRAPRGTSPGSWSAQPRNDGKGNLRIRTTEGLYDRNDAGCCPTYVRTIDWRYDEARDRFVRHRTRTRRLDRTRG